MHQGITDCMRCIEMHPTVLFARDLSLALRALTLGNLAIRREDRPQSGVALLHGGPRRSVPEIFASGPSARHPLHPHGRELALQLDAEHVSGFTENASVISPHRRTNLHRIILAQCWAASTMPDVTAPPVVVAVPMT